MKQPSFIPTCQRKIRYQVRASFGEVVENITSYSRDKRRGTITASTAQEDIIIVPQNKLRTSGKHLYEIRKGADHVPNYVLHFCSNALCDACGLFDVVNQINSTAHSHTSSSQFRAILGWSHVVYFLASVGTH